MLCSVNVLIEGVDSQPPELSYSRILRLFALLPNVTELVSDFGEIQFRVVSPGKGGRELGFDSLEGRALVATRKRRLITFLPMDVGDEESDLLVGPEEATLTTTCHCLSGVRCGFGFRYRDCGWNWVQLASCRTCVQSFSFVI